MSVRLDSRLLSLPSYDLTGYARYNNKIIVYSNSTLKHYTEYYLKNVRVDAVMSNDPKMAHFRPIIVIDVH